MSKPSRRPTREARKEHTQKRRGAQRQIRQQRQGAGYKPAPAIANHLCRCANVEQEQTEREAAVAGQLGVFRTLLPKLLRDLAKIPDVRQAKKVKHKQSVVLLYGLLSFVFQLASRRQANRELSRPAFMATLESLFPELETLPHGDTLNRILSRLDLAELEQAHVKLLQRLIRNKKFRRYLISQCYPIAIDGTQKLTRDGQWWAEQWLERHHQNADGEDVTQQYVYVLEANLVFYNGVTLPLLSEFLSYAQGDPDDNKQDCERRALYRLAERLKRHFPRLPILLLLDGLYPNGPLMALCQRYRWQFMIVLPDRCLPSVWEEVEALKPLQWQNHKTQPWLGRQQRFWWVNDITYAYDHDRYLLTVHVVGCDETWSAVDPDSGEIIDKRSRHVWLSRERLCADNVHPRCNLGARRRWGIETSLLIEKRQGYHYEHAFSYDWNAMQGYHILMRLAHLINALALATHVVRSLLPEYGVQAFLAFVRDSCAGRWLRSSWLEHLCHHPPQLRLA